MRAPAEKKKKMLALVAEKIQNKAQYRPLLCSGPAAWSLPANGGVYFLRRAEADVRPNWDRLGNTLPAVGGDP